MNLWDSLSRNARRLLKGVAVDGPGVQVFSAAFVRRNQLGNSSNAQRAVEVLLKKDIIDREEDGAVIPARFSAFGSSASSRFRKPARRVRQADRWNGRVIFSRFLSGNIPGTH